MATWLSATSSGSRAAGFLLSGIGLVALLLAPAGPARADTIDLPAPQADQLGGGELFAALGAGRDELPGYLAPGPLRNDELVSVEVSGDGRVSRVSELQRIGVSGTGDYFVRESGPATAAQAADGDAPVLSLGDLVWQGFSPGSRQLAARIELDPEIESRHLPLRIGLTFTAAGRRTVLGPQRQVPGAGTLTLTVDNTTGQRVSLPTAADAPARQLAVALDRLRAAASATARLPTTRTGIPAQLTVTDAGSRVGEQLVPLRVRGSLTVHPDAPAQRNRPAATARIDTVLERSTRISLPVPGPGTVTVQLTAEPVLDPASLAPPHSAPSWAAWAGTGPPAAERRAALDLLVQAAAIGSRASSYSPYLGSQLEPRGHTTFTYSLAIVRPPGPAPVRLTPRPVPITLAGFGLLVLLAGGMFCWRRS